MNFIIKDWAGNIKFHGEKFETFHDAWETITLYLDGLGLGEDEIEEYLEEYQVIEVNRG